MVICTNKPIKCHLAIVKTSQLYDDPYHVLTVQKGSYFIILFSSLTLIAPIFIIGRYYLVYTYLAALEPTGKAESCHDSGLTNRRKEAVTKVTASPYSLLVNKGL
ncbi:hypothetical protein LAPL110952_09025 [Lactiplantibacillus plajomi]